MIQDRAINPNQAVITDGTAVKHHFVANGDHFTDGQRCAAIGMEYGSVLNVTTGAYFYGIVVSAYNNVKPYAHILFHLNIANNDGIGRDEVCFITVRCNLVDRIQHIIFF